jgi:hypothetical protein
MTQVGRTAVAVMSAALGLAVTSASAQDVTTDFDRRADFSKCATYAWAAGQPAGDPLADKRIVDAIDGALAAKGMKKVEQGPGCYVVYNGSVREQRSLQVWEPGRIRGGFGSVDVKSVLNGMLVVDLWDAASRDLMWRGIARDTLSDKPEKNQQKLAKVMDKMFKAFPPQAGR